MHDPNDLDGYTLSLDEAEALGIANEDALSYDDLIDGADGVDAEGFAQ